LTNWFDRSWYALVYRRSPSAPNRVE